MIRKRTETLNVSFVDGVAEGWAFDVCEPFRDQLDIKYIQSVDRVASQKARTLRPTGEDSKSATVYRMAWSQGVPPMLSFGVGNIFYDPPGPRRMTWGDALKVLRRIAQVKDAKPDGETDDSGWVKFDVQHYADGKIFKTEQFTYSQAGFMQFLRTGLPQPT